MSSAAIGTPAPMFVAPSKTNPTFALSSVGGRYVMLGFLPEAPAEREAMIQAVAARAELFRDEVCALFFVTRQREVFEAAADARGVRWFHDVDGAIARRYGLEAEGAAQPAWVLLDPTLRLLGWRRVEAPETAGAFLDGLARLAPPDEHAGVPMHAPVLIVPRVFEPELCRQLIEVYRQDGGAPSGVMREVDGRTVGVMTEGKKRRDVHLSDPQMTAAVRGRIERRLLPEIEKAFQFKATRIERFLIACYSAEEGGFFRAHRDNTTSGTAHRKFAVSINLNAEEFEGGDLRFAEFGRRTYRPPTGGAVVFSCSLLHEATPVTRGERFAFLPFLFDDDGERIRLQNRHLLAEPAGERAAQPEAAEQGAA